MRILAISQVFYPDTASTAQHLEDLLNALVMKGHEVSVITSCRNYENPCIKYKKKEIHKGIYIKRMQNSGFGKTSKLTRLIDFTSFNFLLAFRLLLLKKNEYDLVLGMTSPPLLSYIGIRIAKFKLIKFVYWTMDLQPELSIIAKYISEGSKTASLLQKKGDYIFKYANKIITLDHFMKEHITNRTNGIPLNIDVIPVWPVMNTIYTGTRLNNPFRVENEFGERIVVMYSGNHSVMHPLTTLLEAARKLKNDERFLFVHIGSGVRLKEVLEYKIKFDLNNILILPYQPRDKIHISLGSSDIQVVSLGENCVGYTHPNKIYGAMFIGKPLLYLGPNYSHISEILDKCEGNISVNHGESDKLLGLLTDFANIDEDQRNIIGNNNKLYAEHHFSPTKLITKMVNSIETIPIN